MEHGSKGVKLESIEAYDPAAKQRFNEAVVHLSELPFPLLDSLDACRDYPIEFLMSHLVLEDERIPGTSEVTFGFPVAEERILPDSLLRCITARPRAIHSYKEMKNKKYGKVFDYSDKGLAVIVPTVVAPSQTSPGVVDPRVDVNPSGPVTAPAGDDEGQRDDDMFDTRILGKIDPKDFVNTGSIE